MGGLDQGRWIEVGGGWDGRQSRAWEGARNTCAESVMRGQWTSVVDWLTGPDLETMQEK